MIVYEQNKLQRSRQHTVELTERIPISFRVLVNDSANSILFIGSIPIAAGHMIHLSSNNNQQQLFWLVTITV